METITRIFNPPRTSFFLFGPRGTGKSFWLRSQYPDALWIDLLDPGTFRTYTARPERLRELVEGNPRKTEVVIDEVQKAPDLLPVVHALIEQNKRLQFVLTGSSARKLKRTGVDLLAGRAIYSTMHPFVAAELGAAFSLDSALEHGLLPLVMAASDPGQVLRSYAALYVREELQWEGLVRNVGGFSRFLEAISFSHGSMLNLSNVARECQVERKTVEGYVDILEDLLLSFRLPVFTRKAKRELVAHPKFYYFDAGVFRSLRPASPFDEPHELAGAALEGLVAQHLRAWGAYRQGREQLFHWRTRAGVEVDFVVCGPAEVAAIEAKNTAKVRPEDLRGLRAFAADYPKAACFFLYRGKERLKIGNTLCLPCEEFLQALHPARELSCWSK
jgi:predicted AAA+ superfamily ATPase